MMRKTWSSPMVVVLVLALLLAACSGDQTTDEQVDIVATTTILGDIARNIAGEDADVTVLLPIGADPHDYQASAREVAAIQQADLVLANGLGLEEGLQDVLDSARDDGVRVFAIAPDLDPLPFSGGHHDEDHEDEDHADEEHADEHADSDDPHVWMDPVRMAQAAGLIAEQLDAAAPGPPWQERAEAYAAELLQADEAIARTLAAIPDDQRKLVTNHDALGYFAARYDFTVIGVVVPGGATLAEPSSAQLAALVDEIRSQGVSAIFAETTEPAALAEAVAAEAGSDVQVIELYTGSLGGPGSGADTLIDMLRLNAERIAAALS